MKKDEIIKILKDELENDLKYNCYDLAIDVLDICKTIHYNIPFISINNFIRDETYLCSSNKKNLDKVKRYLKKNKLWEVAK